MLLIPGIHGTEILFRLPASLDETLGGFYDEGVPVVVPTLSVAVPHGAVDCLLDRRGRQPAHRASRGVRVRGHAAQGKPPTRH